MVLIEKAGDTQHSYATLVKFATSLLMMSRGMIIEFAWQAAEAATVRKLAAGGMRADGRTTTEVRPIQCRASVLPMVHGSALFTRGETQALAVATLGALPSA